jgi:hypothetical protein
VLGGVGEQTFPGVQIPFAPGRDDGDVGLERVGAELEAHLVIALARCSVGDGVGAGFLGDLHQPLGDQRPRDGGAEEVLAFVDGVGSEHGKYEVPRELLFQVLDVDLHGSHGFGLAPRRLELLTLSQIGGEGDHLAAVLVLKPLQDNGCVQATRVGQDDFVYVQCRVSLVIPTAARRPENSQ